MKSRLNLILVFLLLVMAACTKTGTPDPGNHEPAHRSPGSPVGAAVMYTVTPNGGTFSAYDQRLQINIPQGTFSADATVTLQRINNTSPGAIGPAFRISATQDLGKPITVSVSYKEEEDSLSGNPQCLAALALQDSASGIWYFQANRLVNATTGYVSFKMQEGGDCALVTPMRLIPAQSTIRPSGEVKFAVVSNIIIPVEGVCEIYGPDQPPLPLSEDVFMDPSQIDHWTLLAGGNGVGTLTPNGSKAQYKASPAELPDINPATVLVFLKNTLRPLQATVFVQPEVNGLSIWIGNKHYVFNNDQVDLSIDATGHVDMSWSDGQSLGAMFWQGSSTGTFGWNENSNQFSFEPSDFTPRQVFQSFFDDGKTVSPGDIIITETGGIGHKVTGSFLVSQSGRTNVESGNGEYLGVSNVTGVFSLMRDN